MKKTVVALLLWLVLTASADEPKVVEVAAVGSRDSTGDEEVELKVDLQTLEEDDEAGVQEEVYGTEDVESDFHMDDFSPSHVFTFQLDRYEECFFEDIAEAPIRIRGAYFVVSGSSQEVDVEVALVKNANRGLEDVLIRHSGRNEGTFNTLAQTPGQYKMCFQNPSRARKQVTFALHVGVRKREVARGHEISPLEDSIRSTHHDLKDLVSEQNFLITRIRRHMLTEDSIEFRVSFFTILESAFMLIVTLAQVFYVQRLINNRQWV